MGSSSPLSLLDPQFLLRSATKRHQQDCRPPTTTSLAVPCSGYRGHAPAPSFLFSCYFVRLLSCAYIEGVEDPCDSISSTGTRTQAVIYIYMHISSAGGGVRSLSLCDCVPMGVDRRRGSEKRGELFPLFSLRSLSFFPLGSARCYEAPFPSAPFSTCPPLFSS